MSKKPVHVTITDPLTGDVEQLDLPLNDYFIICTGTAYVAHTNVYSNGTHIITVKGRKS